jgi:hypothetical protein
MMVSYWSILVERIRCRNIKKDLELTATILTPMLAIKGKVVETTTKGADERIEKLSIKYMGKKLSWKRPGQKRVILKIKPEHVIFD